MLNYKQFALIAILCPVFFLPLNIYGQVSGRGGVDQYVRLIPHKNGLDVELDMYFSEIPAATMRNNIDKNSDGDLTDIEIATFLEEAAGYYGKNIAVQMQLARTSESQNVKLMMPDWDSPNAFWVRQPDGENGSKTLRICWRFRTAWPGEMLQTKSNFQVIYVEVETFYRPPESSCRFAYHQPESKVEVLSANMPTDRELPRPPNLSEPLKNASKIPRVYRGRLTCRVPAVRRPESGKTAKTEPVAAKPPDEEQEKAGQAAYSPKLENKSGPENIDNNKSAKNSLTYPVWLGLLGIVLILGVGLKHIL